jgi:DNA-binding MarR family transcriptional regulator
MTVRRDDRRPAFDRIAPGKTLTTPITDPLLDIRVDRDRLETGLDAMQTGSLGPWLRSGRPANAGLTSSTLPPTVSYNPTSPDFQREEYPLYWLARVYGVYSMEMEKALKTVGLDVPTWRTLMILKEQGASSMSDIALHAVAKLSTVTKAVYRIEAEGLVETSTSPHDARVTMVSITKLGRESLERSQLATQYIFARTFEGMTPGQIKRLNETLQMMLENISPRHGEAIVGALRRSGATAKA